MVRIEHPAQGFVRFIEALVAEIGDTKASWAQQRWSFLPARRPPPLDRHPQCSLGVAPQPGTPGTGHDRPGVPDLLLGLDGDPLALLEGALGPDKVPQLEPEIHLDPKHVEEQPEPTLISEESLRAVEDVRGLYGVAHGVGSDAEQPQRVGVPQRGDAGLREGADGAGRL
jgi:hypothetical protein